MATEQSQEKNAASADPGNMQKARQERAWDQEATRTYTDGFAPLVPVDGSDPNAKKIIQEFFDSWKSRKITVVGLHKLDALQYRDGIEGVLPPFDFQRNVVPHIELSDSNLGDRLRTKLGMKRMGLIDGKYRRAEVFGFRVSDTPLGPVLILAITEKGDRGSSWVVTWDPWSNRSVPTWCDEQQLGGASSIGGHGGPGFPAWKCLALQVLSKLDCPVDPRYWLSDKHPAVQMWQATRDRLVLQSVAADQTADNEISDAATPSRMRSRKV